MPPSTPVAQALDLTRIDPGKGKRMLSPGGNLPPTYLITLPADLIFQDQPRNIFLTDLFLIIIINNKSKISFTNNDA